MKKFLLLVLFLFPTLVCADLDGIWHRAEDIKGGIFGLDEQPINNYTFQNNVYFQNTVIFNKVGIKVLKPQVSLDVNGSILIRHNITDDDSNYTIITKKYFDEKIAEFEEVLVDNDPNPFNFVNINAAELDSEILSNIIYLDRFDETIVTISGEGNPLISCNGTFWNNSCKLKNGESLQAKLLSANDYEISKVANLTAGTQISVWNVTTRKEVECPEYGSNNYYLNHGNGALMIRWDGVIIWNDNYYMPLRASQVVGNYRYYRNSAPRAVGGWYSYAVCRELIN